MPSTICSWAVGSGPIPRAFSPPRHESWVASRVNRHCRFWTQFQIEHRGGMAKTGIPIAKLRACLVSKSWTLCIGAGTSQPVFPSWRSLVQSMVERDKGPAAAKRLIGPLTKTFGPDALIQAGRDRLKLNSEEFATLLSEQLYVDVKKKLGSAEWKIFRQALASIHPGDLTAGVWQEFLRIADSRFGSVSALPLGRVISGTVGTCSQPFAILSLNAEPLLYALINAMVATSAAPRPSKARTAGPRAVFDRVTRSVSNRNANRVPFVFCHGLLPVGAKTSRTRTAVDKLVFSESDYLQIANSGFSWQSSVFFDSCMSRAVVFVGLSFSDPNLRRWLGIMHQNRLSEPREHGRERLGLGTALLVTESTVICGRT